MSSIHIAYGLVPVTLTAVERTAKRNFDTEQRGWGLPNLDGNVGSLGETSVVTMAEEAMDETDEVDDG